MKQIILKLTLAIFLLCASGCARMTAEELSEKYLFTVAASTKNALYESGDTNKGQLDIILKSVVTNLNNKFATKATNNIRDAISININIEHYGMMLKIVPPQRHWVTYRVEIIDNKNNKMLDSRIFEDGETSIPAIAAEMTKNISTLCVKTMRDKLH